MHCEKTSAIWSRLLLTVGRFRPIEPFGQLSLEIQVLSIRCGAVLTKPRCPHKIIFRELALLSLQMRDVAAKINFDSLVVPIQTERIEPCILAVNLGFVQIQ